MEIVGRLARLSSTPFPAACSSAISGYTENSVVTEGIANRDINFLAKPFRPRDLVELVDQVLAAGDG